MSKQKIAKSKSSVGICPVKARIQYLDIEIGHRLRQVREGVGRTQTQVGHAIGCSFQQVQKYERGSNHISAPRLVLLAEYLNVPVEEILL